MRAMRRHQMFSAVFGLIALLALGAVCAPGQASAGQKTAETPQALWTLTIRPAAVAAGDRLRLKEIAEPGGNFPEGAWKVMGETLLWKSPDKPGATAIVPADKVIGALRYYLRDAPVEYVAPNQVAVHRGGSILYQDGVEAKAVEYLTQKIKDFPGQATIAKIEAPAYLFLEGDPGSVSIESAGEIKAGVNKLYVVDGGQTGKAARKTLISAEISLFVQAAVATRPINASEGQVTTAMVAFERKDVSRLSGIPWDGAGGPWRVKTSVGQGQVLYKENLEPMPTICRGDKVTLAYRGKRIKLSAEAEAVSDGFLGREITVRNLQSGMQVSGFVEGPGAVVVQ